MNSAPGKSPNHHPNRSWRRGRKGRIWVASLALCWTVGGFVGCGMQVPLGLAQEAAPPLVLQPPKLVLTPPATAPSAPSAPSEAKPSRKKSEFLLPPNPNQNQSPSPSPSPNPSPSPSPTPPTVAKPGTPAKGSPPTLSSPTVTSPPSPASPAVSPPVAPARIRAKPVLLATVQFDRNSSDLSPAAIKILRPIAARMKAQPTARLTLRSYTHELGLESQGGAVPVSSDLFRHSLAQARAVRAWLVAAGISSERLDLQPKGPSPTTTTTNRVEITLQVQTK